MCRVWSFSVMTGVREASAALRRGPHTRAMAPGRLQFLRHWGHFKNSRRSHPVPSSSLRG